MNEKDFFETLCDAAKWDASEETGELEKGEFCSDVGELSFIETNCQPGPDDYYDHKVRENIRFGNNRKKIPRAKKDKRAKIAASSKRRNRK